MQCPRCNSTHIRKNGIRRNKQNHICVDCNRHLGEHSLASFADAGSHRNL